MEKEKLKSLYKEYFQKSRIFLYPALEIAKDDELLRPNQTYVSWKAKKIKATQKKLICLYQLRTDAAFRKFEADILRKNPKFEEYIETTDVPPKGIYIFNFDRLDKDWDLFLKGRYSKFSAKMKKTIKEHFIPRPNEYTYVDSYVNPHKYYDIYSELLGIDRKILEEVGELCSPPDLEKEALTLSLEVVDSLILQ